MKVLVTGSEGFIGNYLCRQLQNPIRFDKKLGSDLTDFSHVKKTFADFEPEVAVHLAGNAYVGYARENPDKDCYANVIGTINLLRASAMAKSKVIFASSAQVYGVNNAKALTEEYPTKPMHPYAISKASAEHYCKWFSENFGLSVSVLRFSNVFGFGRRSDVFADFFNMAKEKGAIRIRGNAYNAPDFVHVNDVVRAILSVMAAPLNGFQVFNVCSGQSVTILEIAGEIAKFFDANVEYDSNNNINDAYVFRLSNKKLCRELGWKPETSLEEALQEMFMKMNAREDRITT